MGKIGDTINKGAKQFSKWATKKTGTNIYRNLTSPYNEPRAVKYDPNVSGVKDPVMKVPHTLGKASYDAFIKPAAQTVKMVGQAIGKGAGRLAYGATASTPESVRPNRKPGTKKK